MNIKSKILSDIKQSHDNAIRLAEHNLQEALKNPNFKKTYLSIRSLNFDIAKNEYNGKKCNELKQDLKAKKLELEKIMKDLNLSKAIFEPQFSCKKCNDTGYVNNKLCSCYYSRFNKYLLSGLNCNINKEHNFNNSNFDIFDNPEHVKKIYDKLEVWCDKLNEIPKKNIVLTGNTGVGKTFLIECLANKFVDKHLSVGFYTAFALNNLFLKFHTTFDSTKSSILDGVLNCDILVIDDLGSEQKYNNVTNEYLYLLTNERLINNKSTLVTTNCNPQDIIDKYGERVFSRLFNKANTITINLINSDLRIKK